MSAAGIIGGGLSGAATIAGAQNDAKTAFRDAQVREIQAREVIARSQTNARLAILSGQKLGGEQAGAFIKGGVDVGSGSPLILLEQTNIEIAREVQAIEREAQFEAEQLQRGAAISREQAKDIKRAGRINAFASFFGAAAESSKFTKRSVPGGSPNFVGSAPRGSIRRAGTIA